MASLYVWKGNGATVCRFHRTPSDWKYEPLSAIETQEFVRMLQAISMHARGAYVNIRLPSSLDISSWGRLTLRATRSAASVRLHMTGFETREQNSAALDVIRDRYGERLAERLPPATQIDWHAGESGALSDHVRAEKPDAGYGQPGASANAEAPGSASQTVAVVVVPNPERTGASDLNPLKAR
jgi:hypothetical protein